MSVIQSELDFGVPVPVKTRLLVFSDHVSLENYVVDNEAVDRVYEITRRVIRSRGRVDYLAVIEKIDDCRRYSGVRFDDVVYFSTVSDEVRQYLTSRIRSG